MAKFISQIGGTLKEVGTITSSTGATDAGKVPNTNAIGKLDPSLLTSTNSGSLTILDGEWQAFGASVAAPTSGRIYPNPAITSLFISTTDRNGKDRSLELASIVQGMVIYLRDKTGAYVYYTVSGLPANNATYYAFPITVIEGIWANIDITSDSNVSFTTQALASTIKTVAAGNLAATDVQSALNELDAEKVIRTSATGSAVIPSGTTLERPANPVLGELRGNLDNRKFEAFDGVDWVELTTASSGAGGTTIMTGVYRFDSILNTTQDPGTGDIRLNTNTWAATTQIAVSDTTKPGVDITALMSAVEIGDVLFVQDKGDANKTSKFTITSIPVDNGNWFNFNVTVIASKGVIPSNNTDCSVTLVRAKVTQAIDVAYAGSTNLSAVNVEAALDELDLEKTPRTALTGSASIPAGTTAQRDAIPVVGALRFNTTLVSMESWDGTAWSPIGAGGFNPFLLMGA